MQRHNKKYMRTILDYSGLGLEMGLSVMIGVLFGHYILDGKLGIEPFGIIFGIIIGLGAAGMSVYKAVLRFKKAESEPEDQ